MTPANPAAADNGMTIASLRDRILPVLKEKLPSDKAQWMARGDVAREVKLVAADYIASNKIELNLLDQRDLVTALVNGFLSGTPIRSAAEQAPLRPIEQPHAESIEPPVSVMPASDPYARNPSRVSVDQAKLKLQPLVLERIDTSAAAKMKREELGRDLRGLIAELLIEHKIQLNASEREDLVKQLLDDMLGLRDNAHVHAVATRIVTAIGRRIDESSPLCDARLMDGSRVNIIIPPLAIDGPTITIRKFSKKKITLDIMLTKFNSLSPSMAKFLRIAGRARMNILISGGTGSGKTTLLNALSQMIDHGERVVTIEDAAELQLQQPHVVRLETRPANLEGNGEVTMRDLVKNALRMRPDRIIVGETRGGEAYDMLQAMNTGHDGSMSTVHANRPREALMRVENLVSMASANLSPRAIRQQIASAVDMIVQVSRMRDGSRRITYISEITGMEGDVITMQDLFTAEVTGESADGKLVVDYKNHGLRPHCLPKAAYFGLEKQMMEVMEE